MRLVLATILVLLIAGPVMAQTWQCYSGAVACAPGSPNCTCTQAVQPPPAPVQPNCPVMTFWNGVTCQVPAPAPYVPQYIPQYIPQYWHHDDHPHQ